MDRALLVNYCINLFDYQSYLEIGCAENYTFSRVNVEHKVGIDPLTGGTLKMTSDEFFKINKDNFDIVFIDGLHLCEQVDSDIKNALKILNKGGTIIVHDCNPTQEAHQTREVRWYMWMGDVWKALVNYRQKKNLDIMTADFDFGCGIIRKQKNTDPIKIDKDYTELTWEDLINNRRSWLRLKDFKQVKEWLNNGSA